MNARFVLFAGPTSCRGCLVIALALVATLTALARLPELPADLWQDEAATLLLYARRGFWYPFTDYSLPNNHMLFSALLSVWWERGDSISHLRLLPALATLLTAIGMFAVGRSSVGRAGAALAIALFCASSVTEAFALALRGYPLSWPVALVLLASVSSFVRDGRVLAGAVFATAAVVNVAILPTNAYVALIAIGWAATDPAAQTSGVARARGLRVLTAMVASVAGLLLYLPHRAVMAVHARHGFSQWSDGDLAWHWLLATLGDFWPLTPLFLLGLAWRHGAPRAGVTDGTATRLLLACVVVMGAMLLCLPMALFPRTLVPVLPLWSLALGGILAQGTGKLIGSARAARDDVIAAATLACFALGSALPPCGGRGSTVAGTHDLCQQFYRRDYAPSALLGEMARLFGTTNPPVLLDAEAAGGVGFSQWNRPLRPFRFYDAANWPQVEGVARAPEYVVSDGVVGVERTLARLGRGRPAAVTLLVDSGYFELYRLHWH